MRSNDFAGYPTTTPPRKDAKAKEDLLREICKTLEYVKVVNDSCSNPVGLLRPGVPEAGRQVGFILAIRRGSSMGPKPCEQCLNRNCIRACCGQSEAGGADVIGRILYNE